MKIVKKSDFYNKNKEEIENLYFNLSFTIPELSNIFKVTKQVISHSIDIINDERKNRKYSQQFQLASDHNLQLVSNFILCTNNNEILEAYHKMTKNKLITIQSNF